MADKSIFNPQGDISFNPQNGTFTVGGNLVVTGTTTYQNDTITLNSADTYAINADNDAATGTLRIGNASSNADISYGASGNVVFDKPVEGNFYVGSGQQIIINGGGSIGGGGFTGNLSGTATNAGALLNDRTLTLTGDVSGSVALGLNAALVLLACFNKLLNAPTSVSLPKYFLAIKLDASPSKFGCIGMRS